MNRSGEFSDFQDLYAPIATSDAKCAIFERLVSKLLEETYLVQAKKEDRGDYEDALRYFEPLRSYFALGGFDLHHDHSNRLIYITNDGGYNSRHLKLLDTVVLLCLRSLQFKKVKNEAWSGMVIVTLKELQTEIYDSKVYEQGSRRTARTLTLGDLRATLAKLRRLKCVNFKGNLSDTSTEIEIYETVRILVTSDGLKELTQRIQLYTTGGTEDEETDEDQAD